jgi:hypothetical protein
MMETKLFVTLPGEEPVWNMAAGRTAALKLLNEQTDGSVMAFEEAARPVQKHRSISITLILSAGLIWLGPETRGRNFNET